MRGAQAGIAMLKLDRERDVPRGELAALGGLGWMGHGEVRAAGAAAGARSRNVRNDAHRAKRAAPGGMRDTRGVRNEAQVPEGGKGDAEMITAMVYAECSEPSTVVDAGERDCGADGTGQGRAVAGWTSPREGGRA